MWRLSKIHLKLYTGKQKLVWNCTRALYKCTVFVLARQTVQFPSSYLHRLARPETAAEIAETEETSLALGSWTECVQLLWNFHCVVLWTQRRGTWNEILSVCDSVLIKALMNPAGVRTHDDGQCLISGSRRVWSRDNNEYHWKTEWQESSSCSLVLVRSMQGAADWDIITHRYSE